MLKHIICFKNIVVWIQFTYTNIGAHASKSAGGQNFKASQMHDKTLTVFSLGIEKKSSSDTHIQQTPCSLLENIS